MTSSSIRRKKSLEVIKLPGSGRPPYPLKGASALWELNLNSRRGERVISSCERRVRSSVHLAVPANESDKADGDPQSDDEKITPGSPSHYPPTPLSEIGRVRRGPPKGPTPQLELDSEGGDSDNESDMYASSSPTTPTRTPHRRSEPPPPSRSAAQNRATETSQRGILTFASPGKASKSSKSREVDTPANDRHSFAAAASTNTVTAPVAKAASTNTAPAPVATTASTNTATAPVATAASTNTMTGVLSSLSLMIHLTGGVQAAIDIPAAAEGQKVSTTATDAVGASVAGPGTSASTSSPPADRPTLRVFPELFSAEGVFTENGHIVTDSGKDKTVFKNHSSRSVGKDKDGNKIYNAYWWLTDFDGAVKDPKVPGAKVAELYFHRNRLNDNVDIWMATGSNEDIKWVSCTDRWVTTTSNPAKHPSKPGLILDAWGSSWTPFYLASKTYKDRPGNRPGLKKFKGE
ncbi:hypothetical protein NLJ89_g6445 [Agrocybe chaxingu]|uniref:Uncharacterized protein n=1 Tax=Agrocybe chaxingu TaxID=84603 RepID=A0A9W8MSP4_9AGAR|nr:hypothetical protein NLJ89_g6445 [Agrocybe chaxingu]